MSDEPKYRKVDGLRTRPVEVAGCLMAFSPLAPKIQWLDLGAWLILELSDGRSSLEIERAYFEVMGKETEELRRQLHLGLDMLVRSQLIEHDNA
ncbi:hypothetical protein LZC95_37860 [Pendulispora brunnea]|uniref:PqqD family protein n=1 Tax=Pendulispora brunnea TaxID=2905690 RepID=A0ABZ2K2A3_9BACT